MQSLIPVPAATRLAASSVIGGCIFALAVGEPVAAQNRDFVLEEIVVTARKIEESLQDAPISVSAFSADGIEKLGARNLSELSEFTPGFSFEQFGGRRGAEGDTSRPVIRGQSNILGEGNAAIFVDGIIYTESILSFPFDIVERVEVIKGPQAALFGRSTFSGAINIITKRGTNDHRNRLTGRVAEHDDFQVSFSSSGPLQEDRLFYFVNARYYDYGGEYNNELDGTRIGDEQSKGLNAALEFRATDTLTMIFRAGYNEDEDGHPAQRVQDRFANNCFLDQARQYFCGEINEFDSVLLDLDRLGSEAGLEREVLRATATVEWAIDEHLLTWNTGLIDADSTFGNDQTFLGNPINFLGGLFVRAEDSERSEWSTEVRLSSPQERRFRWLSGFYYYERDLDRIRRRPGTAVLLTDFGRESVENKAIFGAVEYDFSDQWSGTLELRYQEDEIINDTASGTTLSESFDSVLPRVTLQYQMDEDTLWYASIAEGNKPGAINADPVLPAFARFAEEEESTNFELGLKKTLQSGRTQVNAALYYIDWTQQQLTNSIAVDDRPISFISNAGETTVKGLELDFSTRATEFLTVSASYAYTDATFDENCDPVQGAELTGFDCVSPTGTPGGSVKGNETPNSPKHQAVLSADYLWPLNNGLEGFARGDFAYTSKKYAQVHNLAHTGSRELLNLKAGVRGEQWAVTLFVDNVLDDRTPSTIVRFADLGNLNIGPQANPAQNNVEGSTAVERGFLVPLPRSRQVGVTFSYEF